MKVESNRVVLAGLLLLTFAAQATSLTNWVSSAVTPGQGSGTEQDPYGSVYQAITELNRDTGSDDVVILKSGTYDLSKCYPSGTDIIALTGRKNALEVRSESGLAADVTIDCAGLSFLSAADLSGYANRGGIPLAVRGLTIANARSTTREAAAIRFARYKLGTITDCVFTNDVNNATPAAQGDTQYFGGAVWMGYGTISGSLFVDCMSSNDVGRALGGAIGSVSGGNHLTVVDSYFLRCKTYSPATANPGTQGNASGGAIFHPWDTLTLTNSVFDSCSANGASYVYGGAVFAGGKNIACCYFTNCFVKATSYGNSGGVHCAAYIVNEIPVRGCTFVDCSAPSYGCHAFMDAKDNYYYKNTKSTNYAAAQCGHYSGCLFRENKSKSLIDETTQNNIEPVISNCVFDANTTTGNGLIYLYGGTKKNTLITDCLFITNNAPNLFYATYAFIDKSYGTTVRNCLLRSSVSGAFLYSSEWNLSWLKANNEFRFDFENCTFIHSNEDWAPIVNYALEGYKFVTLRNCLGINAKADKMLTPDSYFSTAASVTNCIFSNGSGVNLDPAYGNQVKTLAEMELGDGFRPKKDSPLVDAGAPVDWCTKATKKRGPWDIGDGTYSAPKAATITLFGKSYDVGVKLTLNNRRPRLARKAIDVGSGEYWIPPGMAIFLR